ncbi:unnamed protein product, partial [Ectocarpus sp. 8 AP-2014]
MASTMNVPRNAGGTGGAFAAATVSGADVVTAAADVATPSPACCRSPSPSVASLLRGGPLASWCRGRVETAGASLTPCGGSRSPSGGGGDGAAAPRPFATAVAWSLLLLPAVTSTAPTSADSVTAAATAAACDPSTEADASRSPSGSSVAESTATTAVVLSPCCERRTCGGDGEEGPAKTT